MALKEDMNSAEKQLFRLETKLRGSLRERIEAPQRLRQKYEQKMPGKSGLFAMETLAEIAKEEYNIDLKKTLVD